MRHVMKIALIGTIASVLVAACGGSSSHKASPPVPASATSTTTVPKTDTVTLLTHDSFAVSDAVKADFTRETGYKLKLVQPGDAGLMVNQAILRKDRPVADAMFGVDNTFLTRALDAGIFDPYTPAGADTIRPGVFTDSNHLVTPIDEGDVCLNYDNTWFDHDGHPPAPTGFASLVDPAYKNLTVVENAGTSSPGLAFLLGTIVSQGDPGWQNYWKKLRSNGVRVVNDWNEAYDTDFTVGGGSGDRPIVVSYASSPPADVVGSNPPRPTSRVGVVPSTCFVQYEFAGVLHGARNVAGARALVDFMLSKRFQEDMPLQMYVDPVVNGAKLPDVFTKFEVKPAHPLVMDPRQIGANRDQWIKDWTNIATR